MQRTCTLRRDFIRFLQIVAVTIIIIVIITVTTLSSPRLDITATWHRWAKTETYRNEAFLNVPSVFLNVSSLCGNPFDPPSTAAHPAAVPQNPWSSGDDAVLLLVCWWRHPPWSAGSVYASRRQARSLIWDRTDNFYQQKERAETREWEHKTRAGRKYHKEKKISCSLLKLASYKWWWDLRP